MSDQPEWLKGTDYKDWLFDGHRCTAELWANLDWSKAYVDLGPSPAGNIGPYWHVPHRDGDTVHRLYPKLLTSKWLNVVHQAMAEATAAKIRGDIVTLDYDTIINGIRHDAGIYRTALVRIDPKEPAPF